jgi:hypothetical protein
LLGRLIVLDAGTQYPETTKPAVDVEQPPQALVDIVRALVGREGELCGLYGTGTVPPNAVSTVPFGEGVEGVFEGFAQRIKKELRRTKAEHQPILSRIAENAIRLSLVVAVGIDPVTPFITAEIQEWANEVAEHSGRTLLKGAADNIAENDKHFEYLRIKRIIERSGAKGLSRSVINHRVNGSIELSRIASILTQLKASRDVFEAEQLSDKGQMKKRFWSRKDLPKGARKVV